MRLSIEEIRAISLCGSLFFPTAKIYLFGSRSNNLLKGGDIDLYVKSKCKLDKNILKIKFLQKLKSLIGEQKIDVLINDTTDNKEIFIEAEKTGKLIMNKYQINLVSILIECEKHSKRIQIASKKLQNIMPLDLKQYQNLDDNNIALTDQLIFRFSKLQDTIGSRLFNTMLLFLGEEIKALSTIDRLNRLEQLGLISSKQNWQNLREIRNNLAYEYEQNDKKLVIFLNLIWEKKQDLIDYFVTLNKYYEKLHSEIHT